MDKLEPWERYRRFLMSALNTTNIGRVEWSRVLIGFVVDVTRGYYPILNEDVQKGTGCITKLDCCSALLVRWAMCVSVLNNQTRTLSIVYVSPYGEMYETGGSENNAYFYSPVVQLIFHSFVMGIPSDRSTRLLTWLRLNFLCASRDGPQSGYPLVFDEGWISQKRLALSSQKRG